MVQHTMYTALPFKIVALQCDCGLATTSIQIVECYFSMQGWSSESGSSGFCLHWPGLSKFQERITGWSFSYACTIRGYQRAPHVITICTNADAFTFCTIQFKESLLLTVLWNARANVLLANFFYFDKTETSGLLDFIHPKHGMHTATNWNVYKLLGIHRLVI